MEKYMGARFYPPQGGMMAIAIIDPKKTFGEPGQYQKFDDPRKEAIVRAVKAQRDGLEVRLYYRDLATSENEIVASQIIETWIPPGHIQPFHTHHTIHEMTRVMKGEIFSVDSPDLTEADLRSRIAAGALDIGSVVREYEMVIEGPGTRHTIANVSDAYSVLITVQTARMPIGSFPSDWSRDKG